MAKTSTSSKTGEKKSTPAKRSTSRALRKRDFKGSVENATSKQIKRIKEELVKVSKKYPYLDFQIKVRLKNKTKSIEK